MGTYHRHQHRRRHAAGAGRTARGGLNTVNPDQKKIPSHNSLKNKTGTSPPCLIFWQQFSSSALAVRTSRDNTRVCVIRTADCCGVVTHQLPLPL